MSLMPTDPAVCKSPVSDVHYIFSWEEVFSSSSKPTGLADTMKLDIEKVPRTPSMLVKQKAS